MTTQTAEKLIDAKKVLAIMRKNWLVLKRDKIRLIMLLMFPIVMILIFGYTAGKVPTNIAGGIVDYDNSITSQHVQAELYANNLFSIKHAYGSQDEGKKAIEQGKIKILFVIPPYFEQDIIAGKTAAISIIVDESDPTIAQLTTASTNAFIQGISEEIKQQRLAMISAQAIGAGKMLSSSRALAIDSETPMQRIRSTYADAGKTYYSTNALLTGVVQSTRNSIGAVYDPNVVTSEINNNTYDTAASAFLLATSAGKQPALAQLALYQGLQGANAKLYGSTSLIYAEANALYANSLAQSRALDASQKALAAAGENFNKIAASISSTPKSPVVVTIIEPYGSGMKAIDFLIPSILALIVFMGAVNGMGRAVAGERKDGSMTRVFLTPTSNITILSGTLLFYIFFETIRSSLIVFMAMMIFGVVIKGSLVSIVLLIWLYAAGATGLGMILSVLSKSEQQFMAFAMLITLPVTFLAGVFLPIETMPAALQGITKILPVSYASDALRGIMIKGFGLQQLMPDVLFLMAFAAITLALSVVLFKRELI